MPAFQLEDLEPLFQCVRSQAPDLLPVCRWLALAPGVQKWFLDQDGREPERGDLIRLFEIFHDEDRRLRILGRGLLAGSRHAGEAEVAFGLEQLVAADEKEWSHPTEIVALPCAQLGNLLAACETRLKSTKGRARGHLRTVRAKLERAARIEGNARRRRAEARRLADPGATRAISKLLEAARAH